MKGTTLDLLKSHLAFLINQYNFSLTGELYSAEVMGNAFVKYCSATVGILIICDRNQVFAQIGQKSWPESEWLQLDDIVRYYYPDLENVYALDKGIDEQIRQIASYLGGVCEPLILGDFSMQEKIKEIEIQRVKEILRNFRIDK